MSTSLEILYDGISKSISLLDFDAIWEGFRPFKFALYNDKEVFFDGHFVEKTTQFCANTSIEYNGELIAIWNVEDDLGIPRFTSCIVHEMFHAFQEQQGWNCRVNEMEALYKYNYSKENLSIKLHENRILLELLDDGPNADKYNELWECRSFRRERFPYEFSYECIGEEMEGSATFVEWQVLKQLDKEAADKFVENMRKVMLQPERFFPIRISGYSSGALLIDAMIKARDYSYGPEGRPLTVSKLSSVSSYAEPSIQPEDIQKVSSAIRSFNDESKKIIETSVENGEVLLNGPYELAGVNIYDARCLDGYITSRFFLMYIDNGENKMIRDNLVIKMKDEKTIEKVYKWV